MVEELDEIAGAADVAAVKTPRYQVTRSETTVGPEQWEPPGAAGRGVVEKVGLRVLEMVIRLAP